MAMQVTYFQRKRRPNANFSLEFIFESVRRKLEGKIEAQVHLAPVLSNGVIRRLWIGIDAMLHQGQINHVTGDINFIVPFLSRKRTIATILDCGFLKRTRGLRRSLLKLFWLDFPVRRARLVTTISESVKSEIIAFTGCDPEKVTVIPVAVSELFQPSTKERMDESPRLLQIGTAVNKNIPRLIEALVDMPCTLVIVGKINDELKAKIEKCGIRYENYMNLDQNAIVEQYHKADVVLFASTDEGFGMPIVEAQAVGRPVVTSNLPPMSDVSGGAACLVDPFSVASIREGITRVVHDESYRRQLVESGFDNAKRFNHDQIANSYFDLYEKINQSGL